MNTLDWLITILILLFFSGYGYFIAKKNKNYQSFINSNNDLSWSFVLIGIMSTQASAITYLSLPGQAYIDGLKFVQFYFGLPLAMIIIIYLFVPIYKKLNLISIYSYLEYRFNKPTRLFIASLFMISRSMSTGISIYAPALILTKILDIPLFYTTILMGGLLIVYTALGGAKSIAKLQIIQFFGIIACMVFITVFLILKLDINSFNLLNYLKSTEKLTVIKSGFNNLGFDWNDKYNIWSGLIGGLFLQLSYFGTDQSQVQRYIIGRNIKNINKGLFFNALLKIPMQLWILIIGILIYLFIQNQNEPIFFNNEVQTRAHKTIYKNQLIQLENQYQKLNNQEKNSIQNYTTHKNPIINKIKNEKQQVKSEYLTVLNKALPLNDNNDSNFILLYFVLNYLPIGFIGIFIGLLFQASWGSIAPALHALTTSTILEFENIFRMKNKNQDQSYNTAKLTSILWGIICIAFAFLASRLGTLIEIVNILGSLFYGVILGVFIVGFLFKYIKGKSIFLGAIMAQLVVLLLHLAETNDMLHLSYLWHNVIGCFITIFFSFIIQFWQNIFFKK